MQPYVLLLCDCFVNLNIKAFNLHLAVFVYCTWVTGGQLLMEWSDPVCSNTSLVWLDKPCEIPVLTLDSGTWCNQVERVIAQAISRHGEL
jgi:hypothetical protein